MARTNRAVRDVEVSAWLDKAQRARERREDRRLWRLYIPMTEKKAGAILGRDLPGDVRFTLEFRERGMAHFTIYNKEKIFSDSRAVDFGKRTLLPGFVECKDQGRGIGRTLMRNQIEFFRACGIRRFSITAGLEAGGYSWARFGFLPKKLSGNYFNEHTRDHVRERYDLIKKLLTGEERDSLDRIVKLRRLKDIWRLADAPVDVGPRLSALFNKSAGTAEREPLTKLFNVLASDKDIENMIRQRLEEGLPVTVGRLCLSGASWDGMLNFNNKEQMKRAGTYVGGWTAKTPPGKGRRP
jgi:hypothetical protein